MKAYIQVDKNGDFLNVNAYTAFLGFNTLGFEVFKFKDVSEIKHKEKDSILVGGIGVVRDRLKDLGIDKPDEIEYPTELRPFLNRKVWTTSLSELIKQQTLGVFVKPVKTKLFQGKVLLTESDYIGLHFKENQEVWCSEPVELLTEWRCFVRYKDLIDVRRYKGRWDCKLDTNIVLQAIEAYTNQPAAYCLDFGVDANGMYYLVEVNDGHSLGTYGLGAISYAKFLSARWSELTNTEDYLRLM